MEDAEKCAHCEGGIGLEYPLYEDDNFWIVCDAHPLIEGHILIIPKEHVSCMGALNDEFFNHYKKLYQKVLLFIKNEYGDAGIFEHGIAGQTVFHAHTHFLPFNNAIRKIVPEENSITKISTLNKIQEEFNAKGKYLFVALNNDMWLINVDIAYPGFFRDRFANLLNAKERGNWKKARDNAKLMKTFSKDISELKNKWDEFFQ